MPCDTIVLNTVELKVADLACLKSAIEAIGGTTINQSGGFISFNYLGDYVSIVGGQVRVPRGKEGIADKIKQAYSVAIVNKAASKYNWKVRTVATNKLVVHRRF